MRMSKKLVIGAMAIAALSLAAPVWAHDDDDWERGRWKERHWKHWKHWRGHPVHERVVVHEYWRPVRVYPRAVYPVYPVYPAPAPGIHVVVPSIYIPFP